MFSSDTLDGTVIYFNKTITLSTAHMPHFPIYHL